VIYFITSVLYQMATEREFLTIVKRRKLQYFGHMIRAHNLRTHIFYKKLSCRKETVRLLRGSDLAKSNWETIFCGHYRSIFKQC